METKYFDCQCDSSEHTIRFVIDKDVFNGESYDDVYLEVQLNRTKSFFKRIWAAVKYVFGYECKYGHWDVCLIKNEDREKIIEMLKSKD